MEFRPIFASLMRNKTGPILVAVQVALSLAILANALHIVNVRQAVSARPSGVVAEQDVFALRVVPLKAGSHEEQLALHQSQAAALRALPGVVSVANTNQTPLSNSGNYRSVAASRDQVRERGVSATYVTADSLVKTYGLKLIAGRDFTRDDVLEINRDTSEDSPRVVIITKALGELVWPDASDYLGKKMYYGTGKDADETTVIGVVERLQSPSAQTNNRGETSAILPARSTGTPARFTYAIRAEPGQRDRVMKDAEAAMRKLYNGQAVLRTRTMTEDREKRYKADKALAWMLIAVSGLLLVVTASGIVGMASLWVTQRRKQIGVRRALGARRIDILRYFVTENVMITSAGIGAGLLGALALNHLLVSTLEMTRLPAVYMLTGAGLFWALGIAAVYGPAWRAASISPALATRSA